MSPQLYRNIRLRSKIAMRWNANDWNDWIALKLFS